MMLFSIEKIDQVTKSYDRCMHLEDGQLVIFLTYNGDDGSLINSAFTVTNDVTGRNMSDGQWHYLKFECKTGVNCRTYLDGKRGEDAPADHSRQIGLNTYYFGYSYYAYGGLLPKGAYYFKGEMKDFFIESNFYPLTQY